MTESEQQSVTEDQELVMERVFNAPRELVWRAWTEPERFASWYGPQGFTVPTCEMDFRVGTSYSLVMRSPDGWETRNTGVFREIVPLKQFVATMSADVHDETVITVELVDVGDGRTKMTFQHTGWADAQMAEGAGGGWAQAFEKLAAELKVG